MFFQRVPSYPDLCPQRHRYASAQCTEGNQSTWYHYSTYVDKTRHIIVAPEKHGKRGIVQYRHGELLLCTNRAVLTSSAAHQKRRQAPTCTSIAWTTPTFRILILTSAGAASAPFDRTVGSGRPPRLLPRPPRPAAAAADGRVPIPFAPGGPSPSTGLRLMSGTVRGRCRLLPPPLPVLSRAGMFCCFSPFSLFAPPFSSAVSLVLIFKKDELLALPVGTFFVGFLPRSSKGVQAATRSSWKDLFAPFHFPHSRSPARRREIVPRERSGPGVS